MHSPTQLPPDREAFRLLYEDDNSSWGKHSGTGSDFYYTIEYRAFLDKFLRMNSIRSIVDIGCGDWQFSRFLNLEGFSYSGFDVVPSVISQNQQRFGTASTVFSLMPGNIAELPSADLLLMKDVLQHLPDAVIFDFANIVFPKFKFCLLTNSFLKMGTARNVDIDHGGFRCLDLSEAPYRFRGCYVLEFASPLWEHIRTFLYRA